MLWWCKTTKCLWGEKTWYESCKHRDAALGHYGPSVFTRRIICFQTAADHRSLKPWKENLRWRGCIVFSGFFKGPYCNEKYEVYRMLITSDFLMTLANIIEAMKLSVCSLRLCPQFCAATHPPPPLHYLSSNWNLRGLRDSGTQCWDRRLLTWISGYKWQNFSFAFSNFSRVTSETYPGLLVLSLLEDAFFSCKQEAYQITLSNHPFVGLHPAQAEEPCRKINSHVSCTIYWRKSILIRHEVADSCSTFLCDRQLFVLAAVNTSAQKQISTLLMRHMMHYWGSQHFTKSMTCDIAKYGATSSR